MAKKEGKWKERLLRSYPKSTGFMEHLEEKGMSPALAAYIEAKILGGREKLQKKATMARAKKKRS